MPRALQRVIHYVHDFAAAAELYRRLGFTVGRRNDFGCALQCYIQVPGFCVELLAHTGQLPLDLSAVPGPQPPQGLTGMMLEEVRAADQLPRLRAAPTATARVVPTGDELRADASKRQAAFAQGDPLWSALADIGFSVSDSSLEEVWEPTLQQHANTATAIAGLVIVAQNPSDDHIFLSAFADQRELRATSAGITAQTARGELSILDPTGFRDRFGIRAPDVSSRGRLAAARFAVRNRDALIRALKAGEVAYTVHLSAIVVGPETAMGATLVFEPA